MGNLMLNFSDEERVYKNGDKSQPLYPGVLLSDLRFYIILPKGIMVWCEYQRFPQPAHVNHK